LATANEQRNWRWRKPRRRANWGFRFVFVSLLILASAAALRYREWLLQGSSLLEHSKAGERVSQMLKVAREKSPDEIFKDVSPAVVRIVAYDRNGGAEGFGSGFFVCI
jgi:hypothetical protein